MMKTAGFAPHNSIAFKANPVKVGRALASENPVENLKALLRKELSIVNNPREFKKTVKQIKQRAPGYLREINLLQITK